MTRFWKGVGVGTFLHGADLRITGIAPARPGASHSGTSVMQHVAWGSTRSPLISLTKSWDVAKDYARNSGYSPPTAANPAYVYEVVVPDPLPPGVELIDPVCFVATLNTNPLTSSYHHDGNQAFLLCIVDPLKNPTPANISFPPLLRGGTPRPPNRTIELETMVRSLRDAEVLVLGNVPQAWVQDRHEIV